MERRRKTDQLAATLDPAEVSTPGDELTSWTQRILRRGKNGREHLPPRKMDVETVKLPPLEKLLKLPREVLEDLPVRTLATLPSEVLGCLSPEKLCELGKLSFRVLLSLPSQKLLDVLRTDPSFLKIFSINELRSRLRDTDILALPPQELLLNLPKALLDELTVLPDERALKLREMSERKGSPLVVATSQTSEDAHSPASAVATLWHMNDDLRTETANLEAERSVTIGKIAETLKDKDSSSLALPPDDDPIDTLFMLPSDYKQHPATLYWQLLAVKEENENLNVKVGVLNIKLAEANKELKSCQRLHDLQSTELAQLQSRNASLSQDLHLKEEELKKWTREFEETIGAMENLHKTDMRKQRIVYEGRLREKFDEIVALKKAQQNHIQQKMDSEARVAKEMYDRHETEVECLSQRIMHLEADLVDNSDDFRPATDDVLKSRFRQLKLAIEIITTPHNLGARTILQNERLDPTGFLQRERRALCYLLRSLVWGKIMTGFFSSPFGFGVLGPGSGKETLASLYRAWMKIFEPDSGADPYDGGRCAVPREDFAIFRENKEANQWRAATFQSILMTIAPKRKETGYSPGRDTVSSLIENCNAVFAEILGVLGEVCPNGIDEEIEAKVDELVKLAAELALEFGSQRAILGLHAPARGELVMIGPEYVDCLDGDHHSGTAQEVELLVSPKFYRIGDGRNDLKTENIIFPGEIYVRTL